jgi:oligoendopeptidase F
MSTTTADTQAPRQRADIAAEFKWDFCPIYADWAAWEAGMAEMERRMDAFAQMKGSLSHGPQALLAAYQAFDEIGKLQYKVYRYPQLQRDVDTRDQPGPGAIPAGGRGVREIRCRHGVVHARAADAAGGERAPVAGRHAGAGALQVPSWTSSAAASTCWTRTANASCRWPARTNAAPRTVYEELSTSDIKFPTLTFSDGKDDHAVTRVPTSGAAGSNPNQADRAKRRRGAPEHLRRQRSHLRRASTRACSNATGSWRRHAGSSTTLDAALHGNAIPRAVVENLVARPRARAPHRCSATSGCGRSCWAWPNTTSYDNFQPLLRTDKRYPYDSSRGQVLQSVAPLGDDYGSSRYRRFLSGGRIDVYESEGKRSGAYNAGVYGVGPYLLLNYNDTMDAVFTLRARGRPRDAHGAELRAPALRDRRLHDLRGRGRQHHQRALPAGTPAAPDHRPEGALPAAAARGGPDPGHLLHAGRCSPTSN